VNEPEPMTPARQRSLVEAADELQREYNVRSRCFPRWVKEGRVSATDAQDRLDRIASAIEFLRLVPTEAHLPAERT
jgi:hypothetical protein